jgi:N-acetylglutamate synthase
MARVEARLPLTADGVTSALIKFGARTAADIGDGASYHVRGDASLMITGLPIPMLNSVLTVRTTVAADDVAHLLDVVAQRGVPHGVEIRPGCSPEIAELARARGFVEDEKIPLMAMGHDLDPLLAAHHPRLEIKVLEPEGAPVHAAVASEGFEAPVELFERLISPASLRHPEVRVYVGFVEGEPVTTALSSTSGDYVGVYDVATPMRHRAQGYGAAITAQAVIDGFESGASYAYLQSTPMGFRVYERLGFRTLETWSMWVSAAPSHS